MRRLTPLIGFAVLVAGCQDAAAPDPTTVPGGPSLSVQASQGQGTDRVFPGRVLIQLAEGADLGAVAQSHGLAVERAGMRGRRPAILPGAAGRERAVGGGGTPPPPPPPPLGRSAAFSYSCGGNTTCLFDGSTSTGATSGDWTFGDGGAANGVTATHTYDGVGDYTVTLTVTGGTGPGASTSQVVSCTVKGKKTMCKLTR